MPMEHQVRNYVPSGKDINPMNRLDKKYGSLVEEQRHEKNIAIVLNILQMIFILFTLALYNKALNMPKVNPLVIEVAPWGEAKNMGTLNSHSYETMNVPEQSRVWQVRDFVEKLRSISSDSEVLYQNASIVFNMITPAMETKVRTAYRNPDVFALVGKVKRAVIIQSVLKVSDFSYQVDWVETSRGDENSTNRYRGVFSISLLIPSNTQRESNPLGIFVKDYDFTQIEVQK